MAWGKNAGPQLPIECVSDALYTTNGALPADGCSVSKETEGTKPLSGSFKVCLDTTGHKVINIQSQQCTGLISHNAYGSKAESGGDGTSMEEKLEALTNIGDVAVTRSAVNLGGNNGGYTWTVTFLRDADESGGQFGGCEQKDTADGFCNSPGDVPKFCDSGKCAPDVSAMSGACVSTPIYTKFTTDMANAAKELHFTGQKMYNCSYVTITDASSTLPPPSKVETQLVYVKDPSYAGWKDGSETPSNVHKAFVIEFYGETSSAPLSDCIRNTDDAAVFGAAFEPAFKAAINDAGVTAITEETHYSVVRTRSETNAPNGYIYTVKFAGAAGDIADPGTNDGMKFHTVYRITFDGSDGAVVTGNEIVLDAEVYNALNTGDEFLYTQDTASIGLTDATNYFVYKSTSPNIKLMATKAAALAGTSPMTINSAGGTAATLDNVALMAKCGSTPANLAAGTVASSGSTSVSFDATQAGVVLVASDEIVIGATQYKTLSTGDRVTYRVNGGSAIGGLADNTVYWLIKQGSHNAAGDGKISLASSVVKSGEYSEINEGITDAAVDGTQTPGAVTANEILIDATLYAALATGTKQKVKYSTGGGTAFSSAGETLHDGSHYYAIKSSTANQMAFSRTEGGSAIVLDTAGTGTHSVELLEEQGADPITLSSVASSGVAHSIQTGGFLKTGEVEPFDVMNLQAVTSSSTIDSVVHPNDKTTSGCVDGNVLRGNFTAFHVTGDTNVIPNPDHGGWELVWNAHAEGPDQGYTDASIKWHLENSGTFRRVNVTRTVIDKYGVVEWQITFVKNLGQTPPGTGDVSPLVVIQEADVQGNVNAPVVSEAQKGSTGLGGTFTVDFFSAQGPRSVIFDETAERMMMKLEEMSTVGDLHIERTEYPSSLSGGWGSEPVLVDGTPGGYRWNIRFVKNPGMSSGFTFPPGSGNVDPISVTYGSLTGDSAMAENTPVTSGSTALSGSFTVSYGGSSTGLLSYEETPSNVDQMLDELSSVGDMSASGGDRAMQLIPGITATVTRDSKTATIVGGDLRKHVAPGQKFRIGGGFTGDANLYPGGDGSALLDTVTTERGSPIVTTSSAQHTVLAPGHQVNIGGDAYKINRTGVEVQAIYTHSSAPSSVQFKLNLHINARNATTACMNRDTTAATMTSLINAIPAIGYNGVEVTRDGTGTAADPFVYMIHFSGTSVVGDVDEVTVETCSSPDVAPLTGADDGLTSYTVRTLVQGGKVEHKKLTLALDGGSVSGTKYYQLKYTEDCHKSTGCASGAGQDSEVTSVCLPWSATASDLEGAIGDIKLLSDYPSGKQIDFTKGDTGSSSKSEFTLSYAHVLVDGFGASEVNGALVTVQYSEFVALKTGDAVIFKGTVTGLADGTVYYLRKHGSTASPNTIDLHSTHANAIDPTANGITLSTTSTGNMFLAPGLFVGAFDGQSAVDDAAAGATTIDVTSAEYAALNTGDALQYSNGGETNLTPLTDGDIVYVIKSSTTDKIQVATSLANALAGTSIDLVDTASSTKNTFISSANNFASGAFKPGDVVRFMEYKESHASYAASSTKDNAEKDAYMIDSISEDGKKITLTEKVTWLSDVSAKTNIDVYYVNQPVTVTKYGWGASVPQTTRVTSFATASVSQNSDSSGYFKIKLTHNGEEKVTAACYKYGLTASEFKAALDTLGDGTFGDWDGNGLADDANHITVTRSGDGSYASGYGYTYDVTYEGRASVAGTSSVLGSNFPAVEIVAEGSTNGCNDVGGTETSFDDYATTVDNSADVTMSPSVNGFMEAGDRIRIEDSSVATKAYVIKAIDSAGTTVTLTEAFSTSSAGSLKDVTLITGGVPQFAVTTLEAGIDAYTYDIYFTGAHLANVGTLEIENEGTCAGYDSTQIGGMNRNVDIKTVTDGGSQEVQTLTLSATSSVATGEYYKLYLRWLGVRGNIEEYTNNVIGHEDACWAWDETASTLQDAINEKIRVEYGLYFDEDQNAGTSDTLQGTSMDYVKVTRHGSAASYDNYGYTYSITFQGDLVKGNIPQIWVESGHDFSNPEFYGTGLNDITFSSVGGDTHSSDLEWIKVKVVNPGDPNRYRVEDTVELSTSSYFVNAFTITNGGTGYGAGDCVISAPDLPIAQGTGKQATCTFTVGGGGTITAVTVNNAGRGYILPPTVTCTTGSSCDITATISNVLFSGNITAASTAFAASDIDMDGQNDVQIEFSSKNGHTKDDYWLLKIADCANNLPSGATVATATAVDGASASNTQLTLASPYTGDNNGVINMFKKAEMFAVKDNTDEVQVMTIKHTSTPNWMSTDYYYTLSYGGTAHTTCLKPDATDKEVEAALNGLSTLSGVTVTRKTDGVAAPNGYVYSIYFSGTAVGGSDIPAPSNAAAGDHSNKKGLSIDHTGVIATFDGSDGTVVVTADKTIKLTVAQYDSLTTGDAVIYTLDTVVLGSLTTGDVYFVVKGTSPFIQLASSYADAVAGTPVKAVTAAGGTAHTLSMWCGDSNDGSDYVRSVTGASIVLSTAKEGSLGSLYTSTSVPLASESDSSTSATYLGASGSNLPIYRVNGKYWNVEFDELLGNADKLGVDGTALSSNAVVSVSDDVILGFNPTSVELTGLSTGVEYFMRSYSVNSQGLSQPSGVASAIPSSKPVPLESLEAGNAAHVDEVQSVNIVASHIDEIQTITTTAALVPEVQEIVLSADIGAAVAGNFSIRFPEIQTVTWTATSTVSAGGYKLQFDALDVTNSEAAPDKIEYTRIQTGCISFDASEEDFKTALTNTAAFTSSDIIVTRSGDASYSSNFGYAYTVTFVGDEFKGNMPQLGGSSFALHATFDGTSEGGNGDILNDAAFAPLTNTIKLSAGEYSALTSGDILKYTMDPAGTVVGSLVDGDLYYVIKAGNDQIQLATMLDDALAATNQVTIGVATGTSHTLHTTTINLDMTLDSSYATQESCAAFNPATNDAKIVSATLNEGDALGTDTEIQMVKLEATALIAEGSYKLQFDSFGQGNTLETGCIPWDATAADMETYIESLTNVDSVKVVRSGDGTLASAYGFTYSIYFDGNALHESSKAARVSGHWNPSTLVVDHDVACDTFKTNYNGVMTDFSSLAGTHSSDIQVTLIDDNGVDMNAPFGYNRADELGKELLKLPMVSAVTTATSEEGQGSSLTVTFGDNDGDLPELVCNVDSTFSAVAGAACVVTTVVDGNVLGGYFSLDSSGVIPHNADEAAVKAAVEGIGWVSTVDVSRSVYDGRGGFVWSITFTGNEGDVSTLVAANSLTSRDASVVVDELVKGNTLGGSYTLGFGGEVTSAISFDATATKVKNELELLTTVGTVAVSKGTVNTEGGAEYKVTFQAIDKGDVVDLVADYGSLTGVGARATVREEIKGSLAVADALYVSYSAPLPCSASKVSGNTCGSSVTDIKLEIDSNPLFITNPQYISFDPDYNVQTVMTTSETASLNEFQNPSISGYFKLTYNGVDTGVISASASATDMRHALEGLPDVDTVSVTRTYSKRELTGACVDVNQASGVVTCGTGCTCDFSANGMQGGDLIKVGTEWFRVKSSFVSSATTFNSATEADSTVDDSFADESVVGAKIYTWAGGYDWTVTFHAVSTGSEAMALGSPDHSLSPTDSGVQIRVSDCEKCFYVGGLQSWTNYYLRAKTVNSAGESVYTDASIVSGGYGASGLIAAIPRSIPDAPTSTSLAVTSGNCMEVTFSPPSNDPLSDVTGYKLQWDTSSTFSNAVGGSASCSSVGFGSCSITDASVINGTPPFTKEFCNLTPSTTYYVRIAAVNSVPVQVTDPSGAISDNTNWSATLQGTPVDMVPEAPDAVLLTNMGLGKLRLTVDPPARDGGSAITHYVVEVDTAATFSTASYTTTDQATSSFVELTSGRDLFLTLSGLVTGTGYFVRVSAKNSVGVGPTLTSSALAPASSPDAPASGALSTALSSSTPIQDIEVTWTAPASNNGDAIDYYKVEWWAQEAEDFTPEIQVVEVTWTSTPSSSSATTFQIKYASEDTSGATEQTGNLAWDINADNMREALLNLGESTKNYVLDDIEVSRTVINSGNGYAWSITFGADVYNTMNKGNVIEVVPTLSANEGGASSILAKTYQEGARIGGNSEVQVVKIGGTTDGAATVDTSIKGFFRLNVGGSAWTNYVSAQATADEVKEALLQLTTVGGEVQVNKHTINSAPISHEYRITFTSNIGNIASIVGDSTYLTSVFNDAAVTVMDGDNSIDGTGVKAELYSVVGEKPFNYASALVSAASLSYTIDTNASGKKYYVAVSARNSLYGYGSRLQIGSATPPKQTPTQPTSVSLAVNAGYSDSLLVTYAPPTSDGGDDVVRYKVELDETASFDSPAASQDFICPNNNKRTVWAVTSSSSDNLNSIVGGYFTLTVTANGISETTDEIPYNAVALTSNETGTVEDVLSGLTFDFNDSGGPSAVLTAQGTGSSAVQDYIFKGDRLTFFKSDGSTAMDGSPDEYEVSAVSATTITLTAVFEHADGAGTYTGIVAKRIYAGRGDTLTSRIHCNAKDGNLNCDSTKRQKSGSVQSKLEDLTSVITNGVMVDRDGPDTNGGYVYRITFMDDAPAGSSNYVVSVNSNLVENVKLTNVASSTSSISVGGGALVSGETYTTCTGTLQVPGSGGGLTMGTSYYARVFAINSEGYSLPQTSGSSIAPTVVPSAPTGVTVEVASATELRVWVSAPSNNGGAAITQYKIEYATDSAFSSPTEVFLTNLSGGSPWHKVITGLTTGTYYYVRVSAYNSNGYGPTQATTPSSLNPHEAPSAPTGVLLSVTSNTLLTASFAAPTSDGGDTVTQYRIEWDTAVGFNSGSLSPHKGTIDVDAATHSSYTIELLSSSTTYFVRCAAINSAGVGTYQTTSPVSTMPSIQVPGKPHTLSVTSGGSTGEIDVAWQRPKVPHHNTPCSGTVASPIDCPTPFGETVPASDGGSSITGYEIEYNERSDFSGSDGDIQTTTGTTYTLTGLTGGRIYYVRVLAVNTVGRGQYVELNNDQTTADAIATV